MFSNLGLNVFKCKNTCGLNQIDYNKSFTTLLLKKLCLLTEFFVGMKSTAIYKTHPSLTL